MALNLQSQMKTRAMISVKITTALLGTSLNFVGAFWLGTVGIVISSVAFSSLYFSWMAMLSRIRE